MASSRNRPASSARRLPVYRGHLPRPPIAVRAERRPIEVRGGARPRHVHRSDVSAVGTEVTEEAVAQLKTLLRQAADRLRGSAQGKKVLHALVDGDGTAAYDALSWDEWTAILDKVGDRLIARHEDSWAESIDQLGKLGITLGGANVRGAEHAAQYAASRVTEIDETTRAGIKRAIADGLEAGWPVDVTARQVKLSVGLGSRDVQALQNFRNGLEAGELYSKPEIDQLVAGYADTLLERRSTTIARTELLDSANQGRQGGWHDAVASGAIAPETEKVWLVADGCCDECDDYDGDTAPVGEDFPLAGTDMPPAHPNCRCTAVIDNPIPGETDTTLEGGE